MFTKFHMNTINNFILSKKKEKEMNQQRLNLVNKEAI